jgi:hypothetical protein
MNDWRFAGFGHRWTKMGCGTMVVIMIIRGRWTANNPLVQRTRDSRSPLKFEHQWPCAADNPR